jgi:PKD repeat protein
MHALADVSAMAAARILAHRMVAMLVLVGALAGIVNASAGAASLRGPRGIVPVHGRARMPFGSLGAEGPRARNISPSSSIAQLVYQGGPVMRSNRVYTIFWQPTLLLGANAFPGGYETVLEEYFTRVVHASESSSESFGNIYSVGTEYYEQEGPGTARRYIEGRTSFPSGDGVLDTNAFPAKECVDEAEPVCLTDAQLQEQIETVIKSKKWTTGPGSIFFLYTPQNVGSCFEAGAESSINKCAYSYYCAYHNAFLTGSREEVIYANIPYGAVPGCDNLARPEGSVAGPAIDDSSHEHNEAITDPTGRGWWDNWGSEETNAVFGFEIGDLCVLPTWEATYGPLASGSTAYSTPGAFNQVIDGGHYLLQQEWSNAATEAGGGCEQRLVPAAFTMTPSTGAAASEPVSFDGSASGGGGTTAVEWHWSFGDGQTASSGSPTVSHTYVSSGVYVVTLTVSDAYGDSNTASRSVAVGPAPSSSTTTTTTTVTTPAPAPPPAITVTTTTPAPPAPAPLAFTASQLSGLLGLPRNGAKLSGLGTISLGHAECPPACGVTLSLVASVPTKAHGRTVVKQVKIGSVSLTIASKGTGTLAITLTAKGRALLRKMRRLACKLTVAVQGQEGGVWTISRSLRLTSSAGVARHARRRR